MTETTDTRKVALTEKQAQVLAPLWQQYRQAEARWHEAMTLLDVDPSKIARGTLDGDDPHLIVSD